MCGVTLGSLFILVIVSQVSTSGVYKLELLQFNNDNGLLNDNTCCSGQLLDGICTEQCVTHFRICLKHFSRNIQPMDECTYGEHTTNAIGNNSFQFPKERDDFTNPLEFPFQFAWPGDFSLILEAYHESRIQDQQLIARLADSGSITPADNWYQQRWNATSSKSLQFRYRVTCDENYYGSACLQYCIPRDDELGHYECGSNGEKICRQGWEGEFCDQAICLEGCHDEHGFCTRPNECSCHMGWEGRLCDECVTYPGCVHGYCQTMFECRCYDGWGGLYCNQDLNYCTNNRPCRNGGTCTNTGEGSYTCTCPIGYTGTNCEREVDNCEVQPCENGGTCKDVGNDFVCECPLGFAGSRCEISAARCEQNPCQNGGSCEPIGSGYRCHCPAGWGGVNCRQNRNECLKNPCKNGGSCVDGHNQFSCVCPPGFSGDLCERNRDECAGENPCQNGGTCVDGENEFVCRCRPGFIGTMCELNVDDCMTRPCANGGSCVDKVNDFECFCAPGFTGRMCGEEINECASSPCMHDSTCEDKIGAYECHCSSEWEGEHCQYKFGEGPTTTTPRLITKPTSVPAQPAMVGESRETQEPRDEVELTHSQLILIVCFGSGIPMVLLLALVSLLLYRRCKRKRVQDNACEEEAQQNEINSMNNRIHNTMSNKEKKYAKDSYAYPTAEKLEAECCAAPPAITLDYKNEASALSSKVIHKDMLKDINAVRQYHKPTNCQLTTVEQYLQYMSQRNAYSPVSIPERAPHFIDINTVSGSLDRRTTNRTSDPSLTARDNSRQALSSPHSSTQADTDSPYQSRQFNATSV